MPKKRVIRYGTPKFIKKDLTGKKFGKLVAIEPIGWIGASIAWKCKCDCGNEKISAAGKLLEGSSTHCGCMYVNGGTVHGLIKSPLYKVWLGMKVRCLYKTAECYPRYGGRGITICDRWVNDFKAFHDDMIEGYKKGLQLDRIDNEKGYYKENCRWSTLEVQSRNKRNNRWFEADGMKMIMSDWATHLGVHYSLILQALQRGHSFTDIYHHYKAKLPKKSHIKKYDENR